MIKLRTQVAALRPGRGRRPPGRPLLALAPLCPYLSPLSRLLRRSEWRHLLWHSGRRSPSSVLCVRLSECPS